MTQQTPHTVTTRPFVLSDTGPDGTPQAMLCTPGPETIIDRDTARSLITGLLSALTRLPPAARRPDDDATG